MRTAAAIISSTLFAAAFAADQWTPTNWATGTRCFDDAIASPLYTVQDPRMTPTVVAAMRGANSSSGTDDGAFFHDGGGPEGAFVLVANEWDSHLLTTMLAAILLREKVGYRVAVIQRSAHVSREGGARATFSQLASARGTSSKQLLRAHADLEVWPTALLTARASDAVHNGSVGYAGQSGLYLDRATVRAQLLNGFAADHWRALQQCEVLSELSFDSSALERRAAEAGIGAKCSASLCNNGTHFATSALLRRDQCHGAAPACGGTAGGGSVPQIPSMSGDGGVALAMQPHWENGHVQQLFESLNLSFRVLFLGKSGAEEAVLAREAAGNATLFYHWQPDRFTAMHGSKFARVAFPWFPQYATRKNDGNGAAAPDAGNFDFLSTPLAKYTVRDLAGLAGEPAHRFIKRFKLDDHDINALLSRYGNGEPAAAGEGSSGLKMDGGDHFRAACSWLRENEKVWAGWTSAPPVAATTRTSSGLLLPGIVGFSTLALLAAAMLCVAQRKNKRLQRLLAGNGSHHDDGAVLLTPSENLRRKLLELQARAIFATIVEALNVVTDILAWRTVALQYGACQGSLAEADGNCAGIADSAGLVAGFTVVTAVAVATTGYSFRQRLYTYAKARLLYREGFEAATVAAMAMSQPQTSGDGLTDSSTVGKEFVQAKYELVRLKLRGYQLTLLTLLTENVPAIALYASVLLREGAVQVDDTILIALCTSLTTGGYKLNRVLMLRPLDRKLRKHKAALVQNGAKFRQASLQPSPYRPTVFSHENPLLQSTIAEEEEGGDREQDRPGQLSSSMEVPTTVTQRESEIHAPMPAPAAPSTSPQVPNHALVANVNTTQITEV